mgnify:CR=1 FL=1|jgi:hypothetical protein
MMTRKDYVKVSTILSDYQDVMDSDDYYEMVMDFGKMMKLDNTRFDLSRFMVACGVDMKALVTHAMSTLPKSASDHVALVSDVEEGWGRAY